EVTDPTGLINQAVAAVQGSGQAVQAQLDTVGAQLSLRVGDVLQTLTGPINGNGPAIDAWIAANTPFDDIVPLYTKYISPYLNLVAYAMQGTLDFGDNSAGFAKLGALGNTLSTEAAET